MKNLKQRILLFYIYSEKLKLLLNLEPSTVIEYKSHKESLKDGSTFRNAQRFVIANVEE